MIEKLQRLINPTYHDKLVKESYILQEKKEPDMKKTRLIGSNKLLVVKFDDETHKILPFFSDKEKGALVMADYIAFVYNQNRLFIYTIEISKKRLKVRQKEPTEIFAKYLILTAERIFGVRIETVFRYIIITENTGTRRETKATTAYFDEPFLWTAGNELNLLAYSIIKEK